MKVKQNSSVDECNRTNEQRINIKIATLVHRCIYGKAHSYLNKIIITKILRREGMRPAAKSSLLEIPHTTGKTFAARSFSVIGPEIWNNLPDKLRKLDNNSVFIKNHKTHLFKVASVYDCRCNCARHDETGGLLCLNDLLSGVQN